MLDKQLLEPYISGFYGYGNWGAKYWFIGIEEGIKESEDKKKIEKKITQKLKVWDERGRKDLEDLVGFHLAIGPNKHFDQRGKLQQTWNKIIHVLLGIKRQPHKRAKVREYQRTRLARQKGDSSLIELLPLPSPNTNTWLYAKYSGSISFLKTRPAYEEFVEPTRVDHLKSKIQQHRPKAVVFYGKRNKKDWGEIAGVELHSTKIGEVKIGNNKDTVFVITRHPNARGVTNEDFYRIGRMISRQLERN